MAGALVKPDSNNYNLMSTEGAEAYLRDMEAYGASMDSFMSGEGQENPYDTIDTEGMFGDAQGKIDEYAEKSLQTQSTAIARAAEKARTAATDALAGTGMGRSGVAAETFSGIGEMRVEKTAAAAANTEMERLRLQADAEFQQANAEYGRSLAAAGWEADQISFAQQLQKDIYMMERQMEFQEEQSAGGWGDALGGLVNLGLAGAEMYANIQTGGAYGAVKTTGSMIV